MSALVYKSAAVLTCAHQAFDGRWPSDASFQVAEDSPAPFQSAMWRYQWQNGVFSAATCLPNSRNDAQLSLWLEGADAGFWLASNLPEAGTLAGSPQLLVAQAGTGSDATFVPTSAVSMRLRVSHEAQSSARVTPWGSTPRDLPVDALGYVDLSPFGPGLYRINDQGKWLYASDLALRKRPQLVVVLTASTLAQCLFEAAPAARVTLEGRPSFWRYFVFSKHWDSPSTWKVISEIPSATFGTVTRARPDDAFRVQRKGGLPWLVFPGGEMGLGFVSKKPVEYRMNARVFLEQQKSNQRVAFPAPALTPSTLSRTSGGAQHSLCSDTFIHL